MIRFALDFEREKLSTAYGLEMGLLLANDKNKAYVKVEDGEIEGFLLVCPHHLYLNGKMIKASEIVVGKYDKEVYDVLLDHLCHQELFAYSKSQLPHFELASCQKEYVLYKNNLPLLNTYGISYEIDPDAMLECYGKYITHFNGYEVYDLKAYKEHLHYLKKMGKKIIIYRRNGFVKGYLAYRDMGDHLYCDEVVYQDSRGLLTMLRHLLNCHQKLKLTLSMKEHLDFLSKDLKYEIKEGYYGHINDYQMFNTLYQSSTKNVSEGLSLAKRPLYLKP